MRRTALAFTFTAIAVAGWIVPPASAQGTKTARGTVTALTASGLTIKAATAEMTFVVDSKTTVEAEGAGTATRAADATGKPRPQLPELIKAGQSVEVTYTEAGGALRASLIRRVPGGGGGTEAAPTKSSNGTVTSMTGNTLVITGNSGGGATFTQTFTIDASTKVFGKGLGTATRAQGGKAQIADLVKPGNDVRVVYRETGGTLLAVEVDVTGK